MAIKHTIRVRPAGKLQERNLTRGTAIHYHCVECCGYNIQEVQECPSKHCALWPYRTGHLDTAFKNDDSIVEDVLEGQEMVPGDDLQEFKTFS